MTRRGSTRSGNRLETSVSPVPGPIEGHIEFLEAGLPELGGLDNKGLVDVAPLNGDSGVFRGKRRVWGGRAAVRQMLYMAAVTAARCNPVFREFCGRLVTAGKPKKVTFTASMCSLLVVLNLMLRRESRWKQRPAVAA